MENVYKYLFPYEKVPYGADIIIYGAGTLGQDYLRQMVITRYCNVVAMADRNYDKYPDMIVPLVSPEDIRSFQFDFIVIALRVEVGLNEIMRVLKKQGIPQEKIVCIFERSEESKSLFIEEAQDRNELYSYQRTRFSIAVLATGGIGDLVIQKRFLMELMKLVPECKIDIYNIKTVDFLKYLYSDCDKVNLIIPDLGSRYVSNYHKYALALTIEACNFIQTDRFEKEIFEGEYQEFVERMGRLKEELDIENANIQTLPHITLKRRLYNGYNAYTAFSYNGVFDISDKRVNIPIEAEYENRFFKLGLKKYITVNYGNGDCADEKKISKMWPKQYLERVLELCKHKYPDIDIVQLGSKGAVQINNSDIQILGEDFGLVACLLKHSSLHLDIEGGLVHIATQLGTKCIVLFGPTPVKYYGYDENINISAGSCHNCWGLYSDFNRCARGLSEPECMYAIKPDMVMNEIVGYMEKRNRF